MYLRDYYIRRRARKIGREILFPSFFVPCLLNVSTISCFFKANPVYCQIEPSLSKVQFEAGGATIIVQVHKNGAWNGT